MSVRNKSTNPIFIQTVIFGMECKLVSNCDATNTYECTLDNKLVTLHLEDKIKKSSVLFISSLLFRNFLLQSKTLFPKQIATMEFQLLSLVISKQ